MKQKLAVFASVFLMTLTIAGCGTLTGIPSHGGGKRFAVEQQLVSTTIRGAIKQIDVSALRGKTVYLQLTSINDKGGGNLSGGRGQLLFGLQGITESTPVTTTENEFQVFDLSSSNDGSNTQTTVGGTDTSSRTTDSQTANSSSNSQTDGSGSVNSNGTNSSTGESSNSQNIGGSTNTTGSTSTTNNQSTANIGGSTTTNNSNSTTNSNGTTNSNSNTNSNGTTQTGGVVTNQDATSNTNSNSNSNENSTTNSNSTVTIGGSTNTTGGSSNTDSTTTTTIGGSTNSGSTSSLNNGTTSNNQASINNSITGSQTNDLLSAISDFDQSSRTFQSTTSSNSGSATQQVLSSQPTKSEVKRKGSGYKVTYGAEFGGQGNYQNFNVPVSDIAILQSIILTYFYLNDVNVTLDPANPAVDAVVYINVDVFGSIRSRFDTLAYNKETVSVQTVLEVMAVDRRDQTLVMLPTVGAYEAVYDEKYVFWIGPINKKQKRISHQNMEQGQLVSFDELGAQKQARDAQNFERYDTIVQDQQRAITELREEEKRLAQIVSQQQELNALTRRIEQARNLLSTQSNAQSDEQPQITP